MNLSRPDSETQASGRWLWPLLMAIAVLLICSGLAVRQYRQFVAASHTVEHTHEVLDSIERIVNRLVAAETGQRGYLLTNDRAYLTPYEGVQEQTRALLSRLEQLVSDNPEQLALSRKLGAVARPGSSRWRACSS